MAGKNNFMDNVAYYFDDKSHGFNEIQGKKIEIFKEKLVAKSNVQVESYHNI